MPRYGYRENTARTAILARLQAGPADREALVAACTGYAKQTIQNTLSAMLQSGELERTEFRRNGRVRSSLTLYARAPGAGHG
jgi:DNA-binding HxlR family transcriptional regulator